jgi:hypothetical protein
MSTYHEIETLLLDVSSKSRRYAHGFDTNTDALIASLSAFDTAIRTASTFDRLMLTDVYGWEIYHIKRTLQNVNHTVARTVREQVITKLLMVTNNRIFNLSTIFENFIKGITYFSFQEADNPSGPIYHRLTSCGPADDAFKQTLICTKNQSKDIKNKTKEKIETCYIERLIYDNLYKNLKFYDSKAGEPPQQDKGHNDRLDLTKTDFNSCFPHIDIDVDVSFEHDIPVHVTIIRRKKGLEISRETYHKPIHDSPQGLRAWQRYEYDIMVDCTKTVGNVHYRKFQAYKLHTDWTKIKNRTQSVNPSTSTNSDSSQNQLNTV